MRCALLWQIFSCIAMLGFGSRALLARDDGSVKVLRGVYQAALVGDIKRLEPITAVNDELAAEHILAVVSDPRVYFDVREKVAGMVARWPYGSGHEHLITRLREHPDCPWTTLHFFTSLGIPRLEPVFRSMIEAQSGVPVDRIENPSRLAAVIRAFERYTEQDDHLVELVARYVDPKAPHVLRVSAANTLGALRNATSIPILIPHVTDRVISREIIGSLYRLTGEDFGQGLDAWKAWYRSEGRNAPLKMLTKQQLVEHRAFAPPPPPGDASFYDVDITGKHILFVLDVSDSMKGKKLERLRAEATDLLSALQHRPRDLRYDFITFALETKSCFDSATLAPNDGDSGNKALSFLNGLKTERWFGACRPGPWCGSQLNDALEHLGTNVLPENNVDTIYLLTDGIPTDAYFYHVRDPVTRIQHRTSDLMNRVRMLHYWYQVRINTFFIEQRPVPNSVRIVPLDARQDPHPQMIPPHVLLRQIAELTSGELCQPE
jgi:hypothetical protein